MIHYTAAGNIGGVSAHLPLIQVIVPQVMSLKTQLSDSSKVHTLYIFFSTYPDTWLIFLLDWSKNLIMAILLHNSAVLVHYFGLYFMIIVSSACGYTMTIFYL